MIAIKFTTYFFEMKFQTTVLFILFFSISIKTFSQGLSAHDLIFCKKNGFEYFENLVANKGYKFVAVDEDSILTSYDYSLNNLNGRAARHISYAVIHATKKNIVSYQTSFLDEYNHLKAAFFKLGYKHYKTGTREGALFISYIKNHDIITFYSFRSSNVYGELTTGYEISLK